MMKVQAGAAADKAAAIASAAQVANTAAENTEAAQPE
jgi:hypothetical protein